MQEHRLKIQDGGRVVIPVECRRALNLAVGSEIVLRVQDGGMQLLPADLALKRARQLVRQYVGKRKIAAELIADRRREAADE